MLIHLLAVLLFGYLGIALFYGCVAPFLQRGVTFWSCFTYALLLPFQAFA